MYPSGRLRVSDAEREAVVARLHAATSEGRLSLSEFSDRAQRAYASTTRADLAALVSDLPPPVPVYPMPPYPAPLMGPPLRAPAAATSPLPLLSLIFGVLSLPGAGCFPLGSLAAIPAVVLGIISLRRIRRGMPGSHAMAVAGVICGSLGIVLAAALFVLAVAVPG